MLQTGPSRSDTPDLTFKPFWYNTESLLGQTMKRQDEEKGQTEGRQAEVTERG